MKITVKDLDKTKKKLKLEIPVETVNESFSEATRRVRQKASIKGFRQGRVPDAILEQHYGHDIHFESLNILIHKTYPAALKEHSIIPLLDPKIDAKPLERSKSYHYEVEVEVRPAIDIKKYTEIPLDKKDTTVSPKELETELQSLLESRAELKPVADDAVLGDGLVANLDFDGLVDGKPYPGAQAQNHLLEYGKGKFLKEVEAGMLGMKKGEKRSVNFTYPADYYEQNLRGKSGTLNVTVKDLHEKIVPKLDEEFAKDLGKESLEVVKKEIEDLIRKRKENQNRRQYADDVVAYLLEKNSIPVPEQFLAEEIKRTQKPKEEVEKSLRFQFIIEKIAEQESVKVEPQEIEGRLHELSHYYRQPLAALKKYFQENNLLPGLVSQLVTEKTLDFLIDKAKLK